jgi:excisionase family DNA binding protein
MTLLTYDEAAIKLSVSERTVERLVSRGDLLTVKVRRARRISDAEIDRFIKQHTTSAHSVVAPFRRRNV